MYKIVSYFSVILVLGMMLNTAVPLSVQAATKAPTKKITKVVKKKSIAYDLYNPRRLYGDEKKEITDATSRCNTPALQKLHAQNIQRAKQDGKVYELTMESVSTTEALTPTEEAYKKYLEALSLAWGAMEEPYCGFGAFGTQAANKSYNKSVERARSRFLEVAKREKLVQNKNVKDVVSTESAKAE